MLDFGVWLKWMPCRTSHLHYIIWKMLKRWGNVTSSSFSFQQKKKPTNNRQVWSADVRDVWRASLFQTIVVSSARHHVHIPLERNTWWACCCFSSPPPSLAEGNVLASDLHHPRGDGGDWKSAQHASAGTLHLPPVQRKGHVPPEPSRHPQT